MEPYGPEVGGIALETARGSTARLVDGLRATQQEVSIRLDHIIAAASALAGASGEGAVFDAILSGVRAELPGIKRVALIIFEQQAGSEVVLSSESRTPCAERPRWISETVCEIAIRTGEPVRTADAMSDAELRKSESIALAGARAIAAVPLSDSSGTAGLLYADAPMQITSVAFIDDLAVSYMSALAGMALHAVRRSIMQRELKRETEARQRLARYHSPSVLEVLLTESSVFSGRLPFEERNVTVMFADVSGFTALSQDVTPSELTETLNTVFDALVEILFEAGGTLDKYIGDCVMGFFGAPRPDNGSATSALNAARRMMRRFRDLRDAGALPATIDLKIALASGAAVVGDIGSRQRIEYTVMGPTVNRASRIEGVLTSGSIGLDANCYAALVDRRGVSEGGTFGLAGIGAPVTVFVADW